MSVKAMGLVWDLECPHTYGTVDFRPAHKYTLLAYADHADHQGKNIYPAVHTVSVKTGYDDRSIQRLTRDLVLAGLMIPDGEGPKGTSRWKLPYSEGGDRLSPLTACQGDIDDKSLGDIPSGDIPSGDSVSPELKNLKPLTEEDPHFVFLRQVFSASDPSAWRKAETVLSEARFERVDGKVIISGVGGLAEVFQDRFARVFERALAGWLAEGVVVRFEA